MALREVIYLDGANHWTNEEGRLHREDGPAIEYLNGDWSWLFNGKWHRISGPSEWIGRKYGWWVNDENITDLVHECLRRATDLPETVHLSVLAVRMCELGDFRLQEILDKFYAEQNQNERLEKIQELIKMMDEDKKQVVQIIE